MTKKEEMYAQLEEMEIDLEPIDEYSEEDLEALLANEDIDDDAAGEKIPAKKVLHFKHSGWCEELKKSYRKGSYFPGSEEEYEILKKYAE